MTSKNYLCKSIKENIRRNMFLTILISLALLVVFRFTVLPAWKVQAR